MNECILKTRDAWENMRPLAPRGGCRTGARQAGSKASEALSHDHDRRHRGRGVRGNILNAQGGSERAHGVARQLL